MVRRVLFLVLAAGLVLVPSVAKADQLVFDFGCTPGTNFAGCKPGTSLVAVGVGTGKIASNEVPSTKQTKVALATLFSAEHDPAGPFISGSNLGTVGFTTGTWISGGTTSSLVTYGAGGDINITGNCSNASVCGAVFSGVFSGPVSLTKTGPGQGTLAALVHTTTISSALLAALGFPPGFGSHGTAVAFLIDLRVGTGGQLVSGAITLVPEPGTLALFGTGLIGLAGLVRRRLR